MLEFPNDFFLPQEREGFLVDATMKTVWAAEMEVLNEVAIVCARHEIPWFAAYGTLLGAVRHGGFIPWDDDIDIWVLRENYRVLMECLPKECPSGYVFRSPHAREGYPEYQVYIDNCDKISVEPEHLQRFHGCPFMVGIDIFPLDTLPDDAEKLQMQRALFSTALLLQQLDYDDKKMEKSSGEEHEKAIESAEKLLDVLEKKHQIRIPRKFLEKEYREEGLNMLWDAAEHMGEGGTKLAMYLDYLKCGKAYEKVWFEESLACDYETFQVPVPKGYEKALEVIYGTDWRTPIKSPAMHGYPCYQGQLDNLRRMVEKR